eukprot:515345_1
MVIIFKTKYVVYVDHLMVMVNDDLLASNGKQYLVSGAISNSYNGRVRLSRSVAIDSIVNDFSSTYVYFPPTLSPTSLTTPPTLTPTSPTKSPLTSAPTKSPLTSAPTKSPLTSAPTFTKNPTSNPTTNTATPTATPTLSPTSLTTPPTLTPTSPTKSPLTSA